MQISISFVCRECGKPNAFTWDTAGWVAMSKTFAEHQADPPDVTSLVCAYCRHVSGELGLKYTIRPEHLPSHERNQS